MYGQESSPTNFLPFEHFDASPGGKVYQRVHVTYFASNSI